MRGGEAHVELAELHLKERYGSRVVLTLIESTGVRTAFLYMLIINKN